MTWPTVQPLPSRRGLIRFFMSFWQYTTRRISKVNFEKIWTAMPVLFFIFFWNINRLLLTVSKENYSCYLTELPPKRPMMGYIMKCSCFHRGMLHIWKCRSNIVVFLWRFNNVLYYAIIVYLHSIRSTSSSWPTHG